MQLRQLAFFFSHRDHRFNSRTLIAAASLEILDGASGTKRRIVLDSRIATFQANALFRPTDAGMREGKKLHRRRGRSCIERDAIDSATENNSDIPLPFLSLPPPLCCIPSLPSRGEAYRKTHKSKLHLRSPPPTQKCSSRISILFVAELKFISTVCTDA